MDTNLEFHDVGHHKPPRNKHRSRPYWNEHLAVLWSEACQAEKQYLRAESRTEKQTMREMFKSKRRLFDKALRKHERMYISGIRDRINNSDPRTFWNEIKKLGPKKQRTDFDSVLLDDGSETNDRNEIIEKWKHDFEALFNNRLNNEDNIEFDEEFLQHAETMQNDWTQRLQNLDEHIMMQNVWYNQLNSPISREETKTALRRAKQGKSTGIDNLPNEILKHPELFNMLHKLFDSCLRHNVIPSTWYKAIICPILKNGKDKRDPLNYRAISLMSTVAKLFSDIINSRITYYMECNKLFADEQNGFRKLRSCLDHLFVLTTIIRNRKKDKLPTYACYIDFTRAFDGINRTLLWHKMLYYKIDGKLLSMIKTMYEHVQSAVRIGVQLTDWFSINSGVRQGDNLAPTLFAIYVNDFMKDINSINRGVPVGDSRVSGLVYADDVVLIASTPEDLQAQLDVAHAWCTKWRMTVNNGKTKIMHFRMKSVPRAEFQFHLGGNNLSYCESYRYLGLELNETLDYTQCANVMAGASSRALGGLVSRYYNMHGLHYDTYTKLYHSLVTPVMDYAAAVWGYKDHQKLNTVQHRAMRCFLGVGKFTAIPALYGELCWSTPVHRRHVDMIRYFVKILNMDRDRLPYKTFMWDYNRNKRGTWSYEIKSILDQCGLGDIFQSLNPRGNNLTACVNNELNLQQQTD
jgi:hypothetical protein